jgi:uncharacterized protein YjbJ (UPF0337 family)
MVATSRSRPEDMEDPDMGDLVEQTKGNVKEVVGKVTGNERMEREGQVQSDTAKVQRQVNGAVDEVTGKVQEGVGKVTGDRSTELAGKAKQAEGEIRRSI